jgi:hypothetical protein
MAVRLSALTRRSPFTSQEDSWYSFLLEELEGQLKNPMTSSEIEPSTFLNPEILNVV